LLKGLIFFVRSRPANFKPAPHPQEFDKSCPLQPRELLTRPTGPRNQTLTVSVANLPAPVMENH